MIEYLQKKIDSLGIHGGAAEILTYLSLVVGVFLVALIADWISKKIVIRSVRAFFRRSKIKWIESALRRRIFTRLAHIVPALIFYLASPLFVFPDYSWSSSLAEFIRRAATVYIMLVILLVLDAVLNTIVDVYRRLDVSKQKPIRSYVQVAKIVLFFLGAILILSAILQKSPWAFLTGLGAMAAVLMLVFKDSILGFVASVQIASYDLIRPGDWIEMPKYGADGDVIEISLNTIKVQNWDKTIVSIPTSAMLAESVKNWRGMSESGGRRIKRHIKIDMNTIKFCDEEMLERFSKIQYISDYVKKKTEEIQQANREQNVDTSLLANGRHLTNVGTFRAYVEAYLRNHSKIHQDLTFLVRQLQPDSEGLPLEIYVFTNDTRWAQYEGIQADIFDHILAVMPLFDLAVFQLTAGQNYKIDILSMPNDEKRRAQ